MNCILFTIFRVFLINISNSIRHTCHMSDPMSPPTPTVVPWIDDPAETKHDFWNCGWILFVVSVYLMMMTMMTMMMMMTTMTTMIHRDWKMRMQCLTMTSHCSWIPTQLTTPSKNHPSMKNQSLQPSEADWKSQPGDLWWHVRNQLLPRAQAKQMHQETYSRKNRFAHVGSIVISHEIDKYSDLD